MKSRQNPIIVETQFNNSKKAVWSAITQLNKMHQWYFDNIPNFKPEIGFETSFLVQVEDRKYTHLWKVTEVIPYEKITYEWRYEEVPGLGIVTFELFEEENMVRLKLTNEGLSSFPNDIPEFTEESCRAGWTYLITKSLVDYLNGNN